MNGPDILIFKKFREQFNNLSHAKLDDLSFESLEVPAMLHKSAILGLMNNEEVNEMRNDYKELVTLTKLYLTHNIVDFTFRKPGALHRARWMAKILYGIKLILFEHKIKEELPENAILTADQFEALRRFVRFVIYCYVPWWCTCTIPADAPLNDLELYKRLETFKSIDIDTGVIACKAFKNHLWYVTDEILPVTLFSKKLSNDDKQLLVDKLLSTDIPTHLTNRIGTGYGKPQFPELNKNVTIHDIIGANSWHFFKILKIEPSFLYTPVQTWSDNEGYIAAQQIVDNLRVVNDSAERGVKLASDFIGSAHTAAKYEMVLQVVENHRHQMPNQREKHKLERKNWFLYI